MTRFLTTSALALAALVSVNTAAAQTRFGLGADYQFDDDIAFVSIQARTSPGVSIPLRFNPSVDIFLPKKNVNFQGQLNLNALYDFGAGMTTSFTPYAGVGFAIGYVKTDDKSDAEPGANFLFGAEFNRPSARPYLQLQISTTDAGGVGIGGGILF